LAEWVDGGTFGVTREEDVSIKKIWSGRLVGVLGSGARKAHKTQARTVDLPVIGAGGAMFRAAPELDGVQRGYVEVLERLRRNGPFSFCKLSVRMGTGLASSRG